MEHGTKLEMEVRALHAVQDVMEDTNLKFALVVLVGENDIIGVSHSPLGSSKFDMGMIWKLMGAMTHLINRFQGRICVEEYFEQLAKGLETGATKIVDKEKPIRSKSEMKRVAIQKGKKARS